jgi:uncharacterized membrane protein
MALSPVMEKFIDKIIQMLQDDTVKKKIEILILQPFLQYFIELAFPYIIIVCVIFGILILMLTSILYILILRLPYLFGVSSVS